MDIASLRPKPVRKRARRTLWVVIALVVVAAVIAGLVWADNQEAAQGLDRSVRFWF